MVTFVRKRDCLLVYENRTQVQSWTKLVFSGPKIPKCQEIFCMKFSGNNSSYSDVDATKWRQPGSRSVGPTWCFNNQRHHQPNPPTALAHSLRHFPNPKPSYQILLPTDSISHRDACGVMAMALRRLSSSINRPLLTPFVSGNGGSVYHMVFLFKSQTYISVELILCLMVLKFVFFNSDLIWIAVRSVQPSSSA